MSKAKQKTKSSKFSLILDAAITINSENDIRDLWALKSKNWITDDLEIIWKDSPEELEEVVRILTRLDLQYGFIDGNFTIIDCPEEKKKRMEWFVKLFAYLESESSNWDTNWADVVYNANEEHNSVFNSEYNNVMVNISNLKFLYEKITVNFLESIQEVFPEN